MDSRIVFLLVLVLSLFGCADDQADAGAASTAEIRFWHAMSGVLGERVDELCESYNEGNPEYHIVPVFRGNYDQALSSGMQALASGEVPHLLQVYEAGTATLMAMKDLYVPVYEVMEDSGVGLSMADFLEPIAAYYSDASGRLISFPFNSSTPVFYYNRAQFSKAGLNPDDPPATWQEVEDAGRILRGAGFGALSTAWIVWIHLENFGSWHGLPAGTRNNGFDGSDVELLLGAPEYLFHIGTLERWAKEGLFTYAGRRHRGNELFYSGKVAMYTESSAGYATFQRECSDDFGISPLPYWPQFPGAPQNTIIGGASLWVMNGYSDDEYRGVAKFLEYLASPEVQAKWHQDTGYLPLSKEAYRICLEQGFYEDHPGLEVGVRQMLGRESLPYTIGLRVGNWPSIRSVLDDELAGVFLQGESAGDALKRGVKQSQILVDQFASSSTR